MHNFKKTGKEYIIFSQKELNNIPHLVSYKNDEVPKPLIILIHGFTENKDFFKKEIFQLVKQGYFVVAMDNRLHGEWKGPRFA